MINWKSRFKNKYFWTSLLSLVILLLDQLGVNIPLDLNNVGATIISIMVALGIIVDNGSEGFTDGKK